MQATGVRPPMASGGASRGARNVPAAFDGRALAGESAADKSDPDVRIQGLPCVVSAEAREMWLFSLQAPPAHHGFIGTAGDGRSRDAPEPRIVVTVRCSDSGPVIRIPFTRTIAWRAHGLSGR